MGQEISFGNITIDCEDAEKLQTFYARLLGWEACELWEKPAVRSESGIIFLFAEEPDFVRPVWPEEKGMQQKQMHLDFQVDNLGEMVQKAELLGAVKADAQFGGDQWVTMADPSGHLFCLCL